MDILRRPITLTQGHEGVLRVHLGGKAVSACGNFVYGGCENVIVVVKQVKCYN